MNTKNPNAILRRIRSSVAELRGGTPAATPPAVHDLIQAVQDLDNHLCWGGTPPDEWSSVAFRAPATIPAIRGPRARIYEPDPVEDIMRRM